MELCVWSWNGWKLIIVLDHHFQWVLEGEKQENSELVLAEKFVIWECLPKFKIEYLTKFLKTDAGKVHNISQIFTYIRWYM